tara:strand:+ start:1397 stop:2395 length:999 start_codon:yes stop_codon:yes gene_type:complete
MKYNWILIILSLFIFVACSESDTPVKESVAPAVSSEPATAQDTTTTDSVSSAKESEEVKPIVVIDALGQEITFEEVPEKIASISPTATEMLYAAGGTAILRDRASNFPAEVQTLPDVGSAYDPSIETIISNQPDLVIIEALTQARFASMFAKSGLKVVAVKAESVTDVTGNISMIGKIIAKEAVAEKAITDIQNRLDSVGADDNRSVLLLISDQERNLYAARPESYTGLIAATIGMDNKAAGLPDSGPFPGFALMSIEAILMANPDVLVTITPAPVPAPRLSDSIKQIPPFAGLNAIQTGNVIEADVTLFLQSPGPRIVEAVEFLKDAVSAE